MRTATKRTLNLWKPLFALETWLQLEARLLGSSSAAWGAAPKRGRRLQGPWRPSDGYVISTKNKVSCQVPDMARVAWASDIHQKSLPGLYVTVLFLLPALDRSRLLLDA